MNFWSQKLARSYYQCLDFGITTHFNCSFLLTLGLKTSLIENQVPTWSKFRYRLLMGSPCHWGDVNGGCVVVGRPHPNHPFKKPHPMVYETAWATHEKNFWQMRFWQMTNQCLQDEEVDCSSHCMRAFMWDFDDFYRVPQVSNEGLSMKVFIQGLW